MRQASPFRRITRKLRHGCRKAADQGVAQAQDRLGQLYETGSGVAQDDAKAALWYRRAADQNLAPAELHLGLLYHHGIGVPQEYGAGCRLVSQGGAAGSSRSPVQPRHAL